MQETSLRTAHTYINDDKTDTNSWVKLLTSEGGEDGNDETHPKRDPTEAPTMIEGYLKWKVSFRVTSKSNRLLLCRSFAQHNSGWQQNLNDRRRFVGQDSAMGAWDLTHWSSLSWIYRHLTNPTRSVGLGSDVWDSGEAHCELFDTSNVADKIVSLVTCTDSASIPLHSDKHKVVKADKYRPNHSSLSHCCHKRNGEKVETFVDIRQVSQVGQVTLQLQNVLPLDSQP